MNAGRAVLSRLAEVGIRDDTGNICAASPGVHVGGRLRGGRWVWLPFPGAWGPLADDTASAAAFGSALDRHQQESGLKGIEIRGEVDGLRYFKLGRGSEETSIAYTYFGKGAPAESRGTDTAIGQIVKRAPTIVARTIGRGDYRWTA